MDFLLQSFPLFGRSVQYWIPTVIVFGIAWGLVASWVNRSGAPRR